MFYWENMSHQCHTRFCHYVTFWFRGYLTSVLCHVLLKRRYVNLTCVYYCLIIKELNAKEFTAHTILQLRLQVVCYLCWSVYVFKVILMSTHKICFYGELTKIILQLSSDTLLICSSVEVRSLINACFIAASASFIHCPDSKIHVPIVIVSKFLLLAFVAEQVGLGPTWSHNSQCRFYSWQGLSRSRRTDKEGIWG